MSVKFKNVVSKDKDAFWVTSSSTVSYCAVVETSVDPTPVILPEDEPPEGVKQPLQQAIRSPGKSTITGKVVKVSPLHMRSNGTLPVRALMMKDNTSKVKVCLFGQNAETNFSIGDVLQVSAVYSKAYQNNMQLTSSPTTKCEYLADIPEIEVNEANTNTTDPDFEEKLEEDKIREITLTDLMNVDYYKCCNKKHVDRKNTWR